MTQKQDEHLADLIHLQVDISKQRPLWLPNGEVQYHSDESLLIYTHHNVQHLRYMCMSLPQQLPRTWPRSVLNITKTATRGGVQKAEHTHTKVCTLHGFCDLEQIT